jgi:hypothetical protein
MIEDWEVKGGKKKRKLNKNLKREGKSSRVEIAPWWIRLTLESS